MQKAKDAKMTTEKMVAIPEIGVLFHTINHYKVLGLPSGEKITDKQISEAFEARLLPLTLEELREKLKDMDWESFSRILGENKDAESGSKRYVMLLISYYILKDPDQREHFRNWWIVAKWLEGLKIINREKEKMGENELMSYDDFLRIIKVVPWFVGAAVITSPVYLPVGICWLIGKSSLKAIQSAVLKLSGTFTDDKKARECSSGGEDIQDWELVNEDEWCSQ